MNYAGYSDRTMALLALFFALILHGCLFWCLTRQSLPLGSYSINNSQNTLIIYLYSKYSARGQTAKKSITQAIIPTKTIKQRHESLLQRQYLKHNSDTMNVQTHSMPSFIKHRQWSGQSGAHVSMLAALLHDRLQASLSFPEDLPQFIRIRQVTLGFYLTKHGGIERSVIVKSSGINELDIQALTVLRQMGKISEAEQWLTNDCYFNVIVSFQR